MTSDEGNETGVSKHVFWGTQPVPQGDFRNVDQSNGPIDSEKGVTDVRQDPYTIPDQFEWCSCDMKDTSVVDEVFSLLSNNYVEDSEATFRFEYTREFLKWALMPKGYFLDWHVGVRVKASKKLIAFISGIPAVMRVADKVIKMAEINFLCVHKKLRSKRLAPVLIKEVTRRVNLQDVWQASYTAGVVLPTPVASCRYWHRPIHPKKLIEIEFSRLRRGMSMSQTVKRYKLQDRASRPDIVSMEVGDIPGVCKLLNAYLAKFTLAPHFAHDDVEHWLMPVKDVVNSFVIRHQSKKGEVTDLISFYSLPSQIFGHQKHKHLFASYSFYNVATTMPLERLIEDALILARDHQSCDVFNALDLMDNSTIFEKLKFGIGDGLLNYYLYNWAHPKMNSTSVGLVLL